MSAKSEPILQVKGLTTSFRTDRGVVTAVDDVSFDLARGETLGIVGESGCGKTVTSKSIMRLLPDHLTIYGQASQVIFGGQDLMQYSEKQMRKVRGAKIAMIFQEPMTSLNPVFRIGWQLDETLKYHTDLSKAQRRLRCIEMLKLVEMPSPEQRIDEYPHQLSGGMRQRVMIAMALACEPDVLIADEPTTALDVTIQAQVLGLMNDLKEKLDTAIILITHDLGVVAQVCDRVLVMYAGRLIENAPIRELFRRPRHPYASALLESIPKAGAARRGERLATIEGVVPSLFNLPKGCRFAERCDFREERCVSEEPNLTSIDDGRQVRCHFPLSIERPAPVQAQEAN
jgi:oligopeptide/dipeptide ABC transporter ATP-binding protein